MLFVYGFFLLLRKAFIVIKPFTLRWENTQLNASKQLSRRQNIERDLRLQYQ
jgi:hypothetical protein